MTGLARFARRRARPALVVRERQGVRQMHLGGAAIQSAMRLDDPYALELDYTRCVMAFLLFHAEPREALMIGLGGGSLAKFFHRHFPRLRTRVIERDERVIAAARRHFQLPPDDERLEVELGEGVAALERARCDLLVVDGYEDGSPAAGLASQAFFDAARAALGEPGALVMNFMDDDPDFDRNLQRIERTFRGAVLALPALRDPNIIVLALQGAPPSVQWSALRARAALLERRHGLPFLRYVNGLRRMNSCTPEVLVIVPQESRA